MSRADSPSFHSDWPSVDESKMNHIGNISQMTFDTVNTTDYDGISSVLNDTSENASNTMNSNEDLDDMMNNLFHSPLPSREKVRRDGYGDIELNGVGVGSATGAGVGTGTVSKENNQTLPHQPLNVHSLLNKQSPNINPNLRYTQSNPTRPSPLKNNVNYNDFPSFSSENISGISLNGVNADLVDDSSLNAIHNVREDSEDSTGYEEDTSSNSSVFKDINKNIRNSPNVREDEGDGSSNIIPLSNSKSGAINELRRDNGRENQENQMNNQQDIQVTQVNQANPKPHGPPRSETKSTSSRQQRPETNSLVKFGPERQEKKERRDVKQQQQQFQLQLQQLQLQQHQPQTYHQQQLQQLQLLRSPSKSQSKQTPPSIHINNKFLSNVANVYTSNKSSIPSPRNKQYDISSTSASKQKIRTNPKSQSPLKPNYSNLLLKNRPEIQNIPALSPDSPLYNKGNQGYTHIPYEYSNNFAQSTPEPVYNVEQDWQDIDDHGNETSQSYYSTNSSSIASSRYENDNFEDEEEANEANTTTSKMTQSPTNNNVILNRELPIILSSYLQFFFNLIMMSLLIYAVWMFVSTVRHDVDQKVEEYSADILSEMSLCSKQYITNNCMPGRRVPYLETMCNSWEKCMNQDPALIGRAKVSAETFGEIINSFLNPIGFKAMVFIITAFAGSFIIVNYVFSYKEHSYRFRRSTNKRRETNRTSRSRHHHSHPQQQTPMMTSQPVLLYTPNQSRHHPQTPAYLYTTPRIRSPFTARRKRV